MEDIEGAEVEGAEGTDFLATEFPNNGQESMSDLPTTLQFTTHENMRGVLTEYGIDFDKGVARSDGYYRIAEGIDGDDELSGDELMEPIAAELASHFVQRFFGLSDEQFTQFLTRNHGIYENAVLMAEIAIGTFFQHNNRFPNLDNAEDFRALRAIYHPRQNETLTRNERLKV